jgi:Zn-dependent M28 family amino/carboxypeptidase
MSYLGSRLPRPPAAIFVLVLSGLCQPVFAQQTSGADDPFRHIEALQELATANGGNRAAGTPGHERSAEYVAQHLRDAGYAVRFEEFTFPFFRERSPPVLTSGRDGTEGYAPPAEALRSLGNSGSGDVTAPLQPVDIGLDAEPLQASTSGCESEDFKDFLPGRIALLRRGTCPFQTKVENARAAGAAGAVILNQGTGEQTGIFSGRLTTAASIPVVAVTTEVGRRLAAGASESAGITVHLKTDVEAGTRATRNVLAERGATAGPFVVVGAHLDSVPEGPGMNDNASGSAATLAAALRLAREPAAGIPVRFAFWSAEERGLLGSRHHLDAAQDEERRRIALYINLDMIGSPNPGRFIQLTQERRTDLVSETVRSLSGHFESRGLAVDERTGRSRGFGSDDSAFAQRGIPTIGLFTGAIGDKSQSQAERFGGRAGQPFDPCYHKACDTVLNIDRAVLSQVTDALTEALRHLSRTSPERRDGL